MKHLRIDAIVVYSEDLRPGDLFSTDGPEYWNFYEGNKSIGERCYIRTSEPTPADQTGIEIYRLEIIREEK